MTAKKAAKKDNELLVVTTYYEQSLGIPEVLETEEDAFKATDLILAIRRKYTELEEKMEERTKPAAETIRLVKDDYKQYLVPLQEMEARLKTMLETFAENRVISDLEKLEQARKDTNDHTLMIPIGIAVMPGAQGEVRFRRKTKVVVVDEDKVPKKYKKTVVQIDMKQLEEDIQNEGITSMPGVEIGEKSTAVIYAKK